jgi:hypothetical protein
MIFAELKPNVIVRGPIFPEPVQVIVAIPMGTSVKLVGKGLNTNLVHEPILSADQLAQLESSPETGFPAPCVFFSARLAINTSLASWALCPKSPFGTTAESGS